MASIEVVTFKCGVEGLSAEDCHPRLVERWHRMSGLVRDWRIGNGLLYWRLICILVMDWQIVNGLADWY